ncbi:inorganic triphosphatase [Thorsellia anophelis]|uniref:CYTH domain-containing protein n=1 Tax=Thorsellia anophelis DSM 18579 TaxID=1123402 RepID=A0A1H9YWB9_9GAMM|nr:CYTH domain-containing protein [Thorsellia anophelis]SES73478.1 CYTH domain-containing protein [Thorsellia anophelis DSM 18579]
MPQNNPNSNTNQLETELKFSLLPESKKSFLTLMASLIPSLPKSCQLSNTYYETEDNFLRRHDMGLRVRGFNDEYEMTLKTASVGMPGIAKRQEYNVHLVDGKLNIHLLPDNIWPNGTDCIELQALLKPQFTTNFLRTTWLVELSSTTCVEVVLDEGAITSNQLNEPICEVEIELKSGSLNEVLIFALNILKINGLRISDLSKAARGHMLQLRSQSSLDAQQILNAPKVITSTNQKDKLANLLQQLLYLEECFLRNTLEIEKCISDLLHLIDMISEILLVSPPAAESHIKEYLFKNYLYSYPYNSLKIRALKYISTQ